MHRPYKKAKGLAFVNPLLLTEKKHIDIVNKMFPRSTGIELEIKNKDITFSTCLRTYNETLRIKYDLMSSETSINETRLRLYPGHRGLVSLYKFMKDLDQIAYYNHESGIHYHIDFPEYFDLSKQYLHLDEYCKKNNNWVCNALDHWRYDGNYNSRNFTTHKTWVKLHATCKTIEFRIGKMSFDYSHLVRRIYNCQNITNKLANNI